jgi:hypothetical protein
MTLAINSIEYILPFLRIFQRIAMNTKQNTSTNIIDIGNGISSNAMN